MKLPHLILDLSDCRAKNLNDLETIYGILDELPDLMEMTKVSPPIVFPYKGGITGFIVIATSHIAIHTFPDDCYVFLDVFSCKDFDIDKAASFLVEKFKAEGVHQQNIQRGRDFKGKGLRL